MLPRPDPLPALQKEPAGAAGAARWWEAPAQQQEEAAVKSVHPAPSGTLFKEVRPVT